jgi:hypothetical protein
MEQGLHRIEVYDTVSVLVVDDHPITRMGLATKLALSLFLLLALTSPGLAQNNSFHIATWDTATPRP